MTTELVLFWENLQHLKDKLKLQMVMPCCKPEGRFTERSDIFFGIGKSLKELIPQIKAFGPEAKGQIHVDAWEVKRTDNCSIEIVPRNGRENPASDHLFLPIRVDARKMNLAKPFCGNLLRHEITPKKSTRKRMLFN